MGVYNIGEVIRNMREELGISRKELCEGICSVETLCRIETGVRNPNRVNSQALMERMGKSGEKFLPFINGSMDLIMIRNDISLLIGNRNYEEADKKLYELKKKINKNDNINKQFLIRMRALIDYKMGKISLSMKRKQLVDALKCTVPRYVDGIMPKSLFTREELMLFCNIAISYAQEDRLETAINMLEQEMEYFNNINIDIEERSLSEVFVLLSLGQCLGLNGNTNEAIIIEKRALRLCLDYEKAVNMPSILYNLAYENRILYNDNTYSRKKIIQAYYIAEVNKNGTLMNHIKNRMVNIYGEEFFNQLVPSSKS